MPTYAELKKSELFDFFGIAETGRSEDGGLTKVDLITGGYQEFIELHIWLDGDDIIRRAVLYLDRYWIGGEANVNPFGKDIAKSFLGNLVSFSDCPYVPGVVQGLWELQGTSQEVFNIDPEDKPKPQTDPIILSALDVYLNKMDDFELGSPSVDILFKNLEHEGRNQLLIEICHK